MLNQEELDASVSICVQEASDISISQSKDKIDFHILTRLNGNQFTGRSKRGNDLDWDDYFTYNIRDLQQDDLEIALIAGDDEVGSASFPYSRIVREVKDDQNRVVKLRLENEYGQHTATLRLTVKLFKREEIVGGIHPIKVTLRPGAEIEESEEGEVGLEKNYAARRNLFSCADDTSLDFEFFPKKFKSNANQ